MKPVRGALVEYALKVPPLALVFELNPQTIARNRTVQITLGAAPGTRGGYPFMLPTDTPRVAQGVAVEPEGLSVEILLDATDRMAKGDPIATTMGIQPEIDVLREMLEPKPQGPIGAAALGALGAGGLRAFQKQETASVLLFVWGIRVLPVFLKGVEVREVAHLPTLLPYRANVTLSMLVIEGDNPFSMAERLRQQAGALLHSAKLPADLVAAVASGL